MKLLRYYIEQLYELAKNNPDAARNAYQCISESETCRMCVFYTEEMFCKNNPFSFRLIEDAQMDPCFDGLLQGMCGRNFSVEYATKYPEKQDTIESYTADMVAETKEKYNEIMEMVCSGAEKKGLPQNIKAYIHDLQEAEIKCNALYDKAFTLANQAETEPLKK